MTVQMLKAFGVRKKNAVFFWFFLSFDCFRLSKAHFDLFLSEASPLVLLFKQRYLWLMVVQKSQWNYRTARRWYKKPSKSSIKPVSVNKVKMQKPSAANQQKQIISNSKAITDMVKAYQKNIENTDYQLASSDALNRNAWVNVPLTNVEFWQPVMRRSIAIQNTKTTTCVKMNLKIRYDMGQFIVSSVFWNVFLVQFREQGAGQISTPLLLNTDYIEQTGYPGRGIKLNPGKYDVLHEWHDQLNVYAMNDIDSGLPVRSLVGDPKTTYKEYTFNCR